MSLFPHDCGSYGAEDADVGFTYFHAGNVDAYYWGVIFDWFNRDLSERGLAGFSEQAFWFFQHLSSWVYGLCCRVRLE